MPSAILGEKRIAYTIDGNGPETILLINGLADAKETWIYQVPVLVESNYRVVTFDNRGIGGSSKPDGPYSAAMLAQDAKDLVDSLGITKFHLMGVSMGGMIAQCYALAYPSDIISLTLACTYAYPGPFCLRLFKLWEEAAPVLGLQHIVRDVILWCFTQDFFQNREEEVKQFESSQMDISIPAYLAQLAVIQDFDTRERLHELKLPTLVIAGKEDILIPVSLSYELHKLVSDSRWITVDGGHGCTWEYPTSFNNAFIKFLAEHREHF